MSAPFVVKCDDVSTVSIVLPATTRGTSHQSAGRDLRQVYHAVTSGHPPALGGSPVVAAVDGADQVHGITYDGRHVWAAAGSKLLAIDPDTGEVARTLDCAAHAGTAFDGTHLYQITEARIDKIDPAAGEVLKSIPAPGKGADSGLAWAEGSLWVGQYRGRRIHRIDPETGAILRTIESNRFVTGVTWVDDELWHATWEGDQSELRHIDPDSGAVLQSLEMPPGVGVRGLDSDGGELFYCGGGASGKVRAVRRRS